MDVIRNQETFTYPKKNAIIRLISMLTLYNILIYQDENKQLITDNICIMNVGDGKMF